MSSSLESRGKHLAREGSSLKLPQKVENKKEQRFHWALCPFALPPLGPLHDPSLSLYLSQAYHVHGVDIGASVQQQLARVRVAFLSAPVKSCILVLMRDTRQRHFAPLLTTQRVRAQPSWFFLITYASWLKEGGHMERVSNCYFLTLAYATQFFITGTHGGA